MHDYITVTGWGHFGNLSETNLHYPSKNKAFTLCLLHCPIMWTQTIMQGGQYTSTKESVVLCSVPANTPSSGKLRNAFASTHCLTPQVSHVVVRSKIQNKEWQLTWLDQHWWMTQRIRILCDVVSCLQKDVQTRMHSSRMRTDHCSEHH